MLSTTNLDQDNDGVPDSLSGLGAGDFLWIRARDPDRGDVGFGDAVASPWAPSPRAITFRRITSAPPAEDFGLVVQGVVSGQSLFDQLTSPFLLNPVSATGLQIGGQILISPDIYTYNSN